MPAKSSPQRRFAGMSLTKEGRKILKAHGKKPMPAKIAREFATKKRIRPKRKRT